MILLMIVLFKFFLTILTFNYMHLIMYLHMTEKKKKKKGIKKLSSIFSSYFYKHDDKE